MKRDRVTAIRWYLQFFTQLLLDFLRMLLNIETMNILMKTFFCHEVDQTRLKGEIYKAVDSYSKLT